MKYAYPLWMTLRSLQGNQRALVVTEPLWSVPYNLFTPFSSVYMAAIGLTGSQIGTVVSVGFAMQLLWGLLSGAMTDKYGRRTTMLVFGLLSWTVPCILWAFARGYSFFLLAIVFNSMWQITGNCFNCILVEDGDSKHLVNIWTLINLTGLIAGFMSPIAGIFIDTFTFVPTMRVIYVVAMAMMTVKFVLQYVISYESSTGVQRMRECEGQSVTALTFSGWRPIVNELCRPRLLLCVLLMALLNSFAAVQTTFWPLFVTGTYGVSKSMLSMFPLVSSLTTLFVYLFVAPRLSVRSLKYPLFTGIGLHLFATCMLLVLEPIAINSLWAVVFSAIFEAIAIAILGPLTESMMSTVVPAKERARINSFVFALILLISTPVGWMAGSLAEVDRALPMVLNACVMAVSLALSPFVVRVVREAKH